MTIDADLKALANEKDVAVVSTILPGATPGKRDEHNT